MTLPDMPTQIPEVQTRDVEFENIRDLGFYAVRSAAQVWHRIAKAEVETLVSREMGRDIQSYGGSVGRAIESVIKLKLDDSAEHFVVYDRAGNNIGKATQRNTPISRWRVPAPMMNRVVVETIPLATPFLRAWTTGSALNDGTMNAVYSALASRVIGSNPDNQSSYPCTVEPLSSPDIVHDSISDETGFEYIKIGRFGLIDMDFALPPRSILYAKPHDERLSGEEMTELRTD